METTGPAEGPGRKGRDEGFLAYQTVIAGQRVDDRVAPGGEDVRVRETARHVPVDAAAGVARLDAGGVQARDGGALGVDHPVAVVHHDAGVDARHAHIALDAEEGGSVDGRHIGSGDAEVVVAALGAQLVVALDAGDTVGHGNARRLAELLQGVA